ncbi:MAG: ATP-binding cassette domain-containing protein, partial [Rhodospirillales bacterium]|nr:ATP-binding cassette domain-containing protein [Rhodospirillales bacterium]
YQHMARWRSDDAPSQLRARLAAVGIGSDIFENPVEILSGGQKARLLLAQASIDQPHVLILDEPTNHLDIESREALMLALNEYPGAVILISHDPHLVETVADRLWLVRDGRVEIFDGDMAEYRRMMLAERGGGVKKKKAKKEDQKDQPLPGIAAPTRAPANERRKAIKPLRQDVVVSERRLAQLQSERDTAEAALADPALYEKSDAAKIERLTRELAFVKGKLAVEEEIWLAAVEELDAADAE